MLHSYLRGGNSSSHSSLFATRPRQDPECARSENKPRLEGKGQEQKGGKQKEFKSNFLLTLGSKEFQISFIHAIWKNPIALQMRE